MFPVSKRAHSQGETLDELQANLREVMERLLEDETPALNRPSIPYVSEALEEDRSLNFYPYCYTESAIFGKGDRASKILTASDRAVGGN
jgi:predicted RNase H-like HicB family nuclease